MVRCTLATGFSIGVTAPPISVIGTRVEGMDLAFTGKDFNISVFIYCLQYEIAMLPI